MTNEEKDLMWRLAVILDACTDHLNELASKELRDEEGKPFRKTTDQRRAKKAHEAIEEAFVLLGFRPLPIYDHGA